MTRVTEVLRVEKTGIARGVECAKNGGEIQVSRAREHLRHVSRPSPAAESGATPIICMRVRLGDETISTFSSQLRFESAREVTISELRLELIHALLVL